MKKHFLEKLADCLSVCVCVTQLRKPSSFINPQSSLLRKKQPTTGPLHSQKYPIKKLSQPF